jgi:hypothetical protein
MAGQTIDTPMLRTIRAGASNQSARLYRLRRFIRRNGWKIAKFSFFAWFPGREAMRNRETMQSKRNGFSFLLGCRLCRHPDLPCPKAWQVEILTDFGCTEGSSLVERSFCFIRFHQLYQAGRLEEGMARIP